MQLYATITSDRKDAKAGHNITRGLGGNKYLDIVITVDKTQEILGSFRVDDDRFYYNITDNETGDIIKTLEKTKGKQKTGEIDYTKYDRWNSY